MAVIKKSLKYSLVFALGLAGVVFAETPEIITLRSKAVHGNAIAQYNLGRIFADTKSTNLDRAEAFVWFQIAADNGTTGRDLARLIEVMTPQELSEGKGRLQERRAQLASLRDPAAAKTEPAAVGTSDDTVEKLTAERNQLIMSLNTATAELATLRVNLAKSEKQETQTDKPVDNAARLNDDVNEIRAVARQLAAKNAQLEDVAAERGRDLQAAQVELAKLKAEASPAPAAATQDMQLTAMTAERDLLLKQLSEAQDKFRKVAEMPDRLSRAERDASLLRNQNSKLSASLRDAEAQLKAAPAPSVKEVAVSRDAQLAAAKKDVDDLNKKNLDLADRAQRGYAAEQELASARDRIAAEQRKVEELTASAAQLALANEKLRNEANAKTSSGEMQALRAQVAAMERQNTELADRATAAETKLAAMPAPAPVQVQAAPEDDTSKKQLEETSDKLATALRSYTLLQQELDQTKTVSGQASAETNAKLSTAESEIAALRNQLTAATGESQDRANALSAMQREMEQQRHTMITQGQETLALRDQLRQTLGQVGVLADENSQLKTRIAVLAPPPASSMANPTRPGTAAAQAAITLPPTLTKPAVADRASGTRQHIIGDGDSLSRISRRYYGTPDRWKTIYDANRNILSDPSRLPKGAALIIP